MSSNAALKAGGQIIGHQFVPAYQVARFLPHRHRVLKLYKKAWRSISAHNVDAYVMRPYLSTHIMCFEHAVLRARFDENKHVTSLAKATELLKGIRMLQREFHWTRFIRWRRRILAESALRSRWARKAPRFTRWHVIPAMGSYDAGKQCPQRLGSWRLG